MRSRLEREGGCSWRRRLRRRLCDNAGDGAGKVYHSGAGRGHTLVASMRSQRRWSSCRFACQDDATSVTVTGYGPPAFSPVGAKRQEPSWGLGAGMRRLGRGLSAGEREVILNVRA